MLISSSFAVRATPVPTLDVPRLTETSDLVIVGAVLSSQDSGPTAVDFQGTSVDARKMVCRVRVDLVLKGHYGTGQLLFTYLLPDSPIGYESVTVSSYSIIFLKSTDNGYAVVSPYYVSLPAVPGAVATNRRTVDNIVQILQGVVQGTQVGENSKQTALFALSTVPSAQSTEALELGLQQSDLGVRLNAAAFLLQRDKVSALNVAESAMLYLPPEVPGYIVHNLAYGMCEGLRDPEAVPSLIRLQQASNAEVRRAVSCALGNTGSRAAILPLARALSDSDLETRYNGVIGLAKITRQFDWGPNRELFQSDQEKFLTHWQNWASANTN
jgi:HEAT repeat protein